MCIVRIFLTSALFLRWWPIFWKFKIFQNFCSNLSEKLFLVLNGDKSIIIQVLGSNYIDSNFLNSRKINFPEISFAFLVKPCQKSWCSRPHPDTIFQNNFDLRVFIKYGIRLLKAQIFKSYRYFVIQKCFGGRAFLLPSQKYC